MTLTPNAHATSRRNLAQRIERLLRRQEALPTPTLTGWQADQVMTAIEALDEEGLADGESVMMKVERPDVWEPAGYIPADRKDAGQLLKRLARVREV